MKRQTIERELRNSHRRNDGCMGRAVVVFLVTPGYVCPMDVNGSDDARRIMGLWLVKSASFTFCDDGSGRMDVRVKTHHGADGFREAAVHLTEWCREVSARGSAVRVVPFLARQATDARERSK